MSDHRLAQERADVGRTFGLDELGNQLYHPAVDPHADVRLASVREQFTVDRLDDRRE